MLTVNVHTSCTHVVLLAASCRFLLVFAMQFEKMARSNVDRAQTESQMSALNSERVELLNKECERYQQRAYSAEKVAKDMEQAMEPLKERIRGLETDKAVLEAETSRQKGMTPCGYSLLLPGASQSLQGVPLLVSSCCRRIEVLPCALGHHPAAGSVD